MGSWAFSRLGIWGAGTKATRHSKLLALEPLGVSVAGDCPTTRSFKRDEHGLVYRRRREPKRWKYSPHQPKLGHDLQT